MTAPWRSAFVAVGSALALGLTACGGGGQVSGPNAGPGPRDPGTGPDLPAGSYTLEQINNSAPGQLVTISNPDGKVIGLYRFDESDLELDGQQGFALTLRYSNDVKQLLIEDRGGFDQEGPVSQDGWLPLTFRSVVYGDAFTAVSQSNIVAIKYDFDGDGQMDTSFGFRRVE